MVQESPEIEERQNFKTRRCQNQAVPREGVVLSVLWLELILAFITPERETKGLYYNMAVLRSFEFFFKVKKKRSLNI